MRAPATERMLRTFALAAGVLGALFWLGSLVRWWMIPAINRDGLELAGIIMSTTYLLILPLPALLLGWRGKGLVVAAPLGLVALAIASDVLLPWIPWGLVP